MATLLVSFKRISRYNCQVVDKTFDSGALAQIMLGGSLKV